MPGFYMKCSAGLKQIKVSADKDMFEVDCKEQGVKPFQSLE